MRRILTLLLSVCLLLTLSGCGEGRYPTVADDGSSWDRSWEMLGTSLGVEAPADLTLLNNDVVLAADDTYYASYVTGEAVPYVNADGDDVDLYPAQLYLLYDGCKDEEAATQALGDFLDREMATYDVTEQTQERYNGQPYTILRYTCLSDTNPYARGISAFGVFHHYVIVAELCCVDSFDGDEAAMLASFLNGCHYSSDAL